MFWLAVFSVESCDSYFLRHGFANQPPLVSFCKVPDCVFVSKVLKIKWNGFWWPVTDSPLWFCHGQVIHKSVFRSQTRYKLKLLSRSGRVLKNALSLILIYCVNSITAKKGVQNCLFIVCYKASCTKRSYYIRCYKNERYMILPSRHY